MKTLVDFTLPPSGKGQPAWALDMSRKRNRELAEENSKLIAENARLCVAHADLRKRLERLEYTVQLLRTRA